MKLIFSSIIAIVFLSLTGCGNQENDDLSKKKNGMSTLEKLSIFQKMKNQYLLSE